jgi:hypothetical protein
VNSIQFRNWVMTDAEIAALGTATAGGIRAAHDCPPQTSGGNITLNWFGGTAPTRCRRKTASLTLTGWMW